MIFLQKEKKLNSLWYHKKFNPPCTITRPEIYPEFKIHLSTLTRGLNAHKYGRPTIIAQINTQLRGRVSLGASTQKLNILEVRGFGSRLRLTM